MIDQSTVHQAEPLITFSVPCRQCGGVAKYMLHFGTPLCHPCLWKVVEGLNQQFYGDPYYGHISVRQVDMRDTLLAELRRRGVQASEVYPAIVMGGRG